MHFKTVCQLIIGNQRYGHKLDVYRYVGDIRNRPISVIKSLSKSICENLVCLHWLNYQKCNAEDNTKSN